MFTICFSNVFCIILSLLILFTSPAYAIDVYSLNDGDYSFSGWESDRGKACVLDGTIMKGDYEKVVNFTRERKSGNQEIQCEIIYLNSDGGSLNVAIEIMDHLFNSMIATSVRKQDRCVSACAIIWLGGAVPWGHSKDNPHSYRRIEPGAELGFHAPYPLLPEGSTSNSEVTRAFIEAFGLAQRLLQIFQDRKIPLWFALKLMHPHRDEYFYIDNIEKVNLIQAELDIDLDKLKIVTNEMIQRMCFNLSRWGKGLSAIGELKSYSNNINYLDTYEEYDIFLKNSKLSQTYPKYIANLVSFLDQLRYTSEEAIKIREFLTQDDIYDKLEDIYKELKIDGGIDASKREELYEFYSAIAYGVGRQIQAVRPSFLQWKHEGHFKADTYLFPSPGVVGPFDENTRDRPLFCGIHIGDLGSSPFVDFHPDFKKTFGVLYSASHGTEFDHYQNIEHLPAALLGLPAETKLEDINRLLDITTDKVILE